MVRIRGGPRALGSGTGRGMGRDEDDIDVPRHRRPIASTHRQRVQVDVAEEVPQVTEDVPPQVTEDIPDVTEDVPHVDEDILTADVDATDVAVDGAEGSLAEHGKGFPGGPHDTSLLTSFAYHVAYSIWCGKLVSHGRKVDKFGSPAPEIEGLVAGTRLSPWIGCSVVTDDPGLISAFAERWHRETSTFHLPVGELTITLDDVACLLYLPITGALHRFEPLCVDEVVLLLTELLEVSGEEAQAETVRTHGAYVRLSWLREVYESRCQARHWIAAARAYLLHLVGCTLFANKSATHVHVVHLEAFRDLGQSGAMPGELSCCVHQCITDYAYAETTPCASRWLTTKAHMKRIKGAPYRARLDALTITNVSWFPYSENRAVRGFELISCYQGQLRWGHVVVYVRPERVVRQFGYIQTIPPLLVTASLS
ncbi:Protein MAIN-LIKE 1 [Glycine max]|uniref:protein MAIN-LIKE 1-like n=1 Tax=Glycine max TaxID=3847 RepID=UPI0003DEB8B5|nr:protein MAIN-LIKE 1-like [Glycine max]KAH1221695.1 Protein MAIN-LIKE 1 [Glycine max]|eukprot:XP_006593213.1 protein MAIN-LIKE 1-like [Glycine max]